MNEEILIELPILPDHAAPGAGSDPDDIWSLSSVAELSARLASIADTAGFEGAALLVAAPGEAGGGILRLVEEGRRLPVSELAFEAFRSRFAEALGRSSVPFRWIGSGEADAFESGFGTGVLRECGRVQVSVGGFCVPVRSGLRRVGGVVLLGSWPGLGALDVFALRVFAMSWFARFSQIEAAVSERAHVTPRERECLQLASNGLTSEAIARRLTLSKHTVDHHLVSATIKLKAANRAHAIAESLRLGIVV